MTACCGRQEWARAWVPCWSFRARYCHRWGEVMLDMPWPLEWNWVTVFRPCWNGAVWVEGEGA